MASRRTCPKVTTDYSQETVSSKEISKKMGGDNGTNGTSGKRGHRRKFRSSFDARQQKTAAITIVLLTILVITSMITSPQSPATISNSALRSRGISYSDLTPPAKTKITNGIYNSSPPPPIENNCHVVAGVQPDHPITSTFTASYPGSGAKMTWMLIEALTGLVTGDDFQLNGHENTVSIKTHYPSHEGREIPNADNIPRAVLLIRHPLHAIPSYFNFLYEMENKLANHSTRAPLDAWITWRNNNFDRQLQVWRRHTEYWMDRYTKIHRVVIAYEKLTSDDKGASEALRLAEFLNRSDGVTTAPPNEVPCVWHTVVKYKGSKGKGDSGGRRRLQEVETPPEAPGVQKQQVQTPSVAANEVPKKEPEVSKTVAVDKNAIQPQQPAVVTNINPPQKKGTEAQKAPPPPPPAAARNISKQQEAQNQVAESQQEQPQTPTVTDVMHQKEQQKRQKEQQQKMQEDQAKAMSESIRNNANGESDAGPEVSDPNDPKSKRSGPKYIAPYNPRQLKDMLQILTQLLERYRDDSGLAPVLVSYIDEVARRSEGPPEDENTVVSQA